MQLSRKVLNEGILLDSDVYSKTATCTAVPPESLFLPLSLWPELLAANILCMLSATLGALGFWVNSLQQVWQPYDTDLVDSTLAGEETEA